MTGSLRTILLAIKIIIIMNQNDIRDTFFRIETENHLFDLVDKKGNRSWDIIRSSVYFNILFHYFPVATPPNFEIMAHFYIFYKSLE